MHHLKLLGVDAKRLLWRLSGKAGRIHATHAMFSAVPFDRLIEVYPELFFRFRRATEDLCISLRQKTQDDDAAFLLKHRPSWTNFQDPLEIEWDVTKIVDLLSPDSSPSLPPSHLLTGLTLRRSD